MQALLASPSGDAHLEDYCRSVAGFYAGDGAAPMPYSVAAVFVGCAQLAARGSGTQRASLMRAAVYQLAVANATELAPMDPRLAARDSGVLQHVLPPCCITAAAVALRSTDPDLDAASRVRRCHTHTARPVTYSCRFISNSSAVTRRRHTEASLSAMLDSN